MMKQILLLFLCSNISFILSFITTQSASIYYDNQKFPPYKIVLNTWDPSAVAYARFKTTLPTKGFDKLKIITNQNNRYSDEVLSYAAGYLEGYFTRNRILDHYRNIQEKTWGKLGKMPATIRSFFIENRQFILNMYNLNPQDNYWKLVYTIYMQYEGLVQAYNDSTELFKIDYVDFQTMNSMGDLLDLIYYKSPPNFDNMTYSDIINLIQRSSHCSALIKFSPETKELFFGHNTWFYYSSMTRIFKEYSFKFSNPLQKTTNIMFSSYAGAISSIDDFYITNRDLVVMETTNVFFNSELYKSNLTPRSILSWLRAMVSNFIASDSLEWVETYAKNNSGTYNNQYMVLDLKLIEIETGIIPNNSLWIIEQIPGKTVSEDVSSYLRQGYWASYNTPFFTEISKFSKIDIIIQKDKRLINTLSYESSARALMFKRDQQNITNYESFKTYMRYNNYQNDTLSQGNPSLAISSRNDLDESKETICLGALDAKVGSINNIKGVIRKKVSVIGSPTNINQKSFRWTDSSICMNEPRFGLAEVYNFDWFDYIMNNDDIE